MAPSTARLANLEIPAYAPEDDAPVWERARGEHVTAADGRTFIDLQMGHGACLWGHGTIYERILDRYEPDVLANAFGSHHTTTLRQRATTRLREFAARHWDAGEPLAAALLHTGSEAVELALKTALLATGRSKVIAFENCYHGSFGLALAATHGSAVRDAFGDVVRLDAVEHVAYGDVPEIGDDVAAVIVEPIQGNAAVLLPPEGYLQELRAACERAGALLIVDSVLAGCGRTGTPLEGAEANPDILVLAKALGGGMICSAVLCRGSVAQRAWGGDDAPSAGTTYYGHPFTCGAILEVLELLESHDLGELSSPFAQAMKDVGETTGLDVRGKGAFWGVRAGKDDGPQLSQQLLRMGFITSPSGADNEGISLTPSLLMQRESIERFAEALKVCAAGLSRS